MPVGKRAAGASAERAFRTGVAGAARRGRLVLAFRTGVAARTLRTAGLPTAHPDVFCFAGWPGAIAQVDGSFSHSHRRGSSLSPLLVALWSMCDTV